MPSPSSVEEIEINKALKRIGATKFYKKSSVLTIMFGKNTILQFDVDKNKVQKTKENMVDVAHDIKINDGIINELKIILTRDYEEYLKQPEVEENGNQERQRPAQIALELTEQKCKKLFLDQFGTPYIALEINDHIETLQLKQSRFRNWLNMFYHVSENDTIGSEIITTVINILTAWAEFDSDSETVELFVRVGVLENEPNTIYYDLTNKKWEVVKITPQGWKIISSQDAPILFTRFANQKAQVYPGKSKDYLPDIFDKFIELINLSNGKTAEGINAAKSTKIMLKCYIICIFFVKIAKAISMTRGEQGAAKSTSQALVKMLIDPSAARLLGLPDSRNELIQILSHNYIAYFDNVSFIKDWLVDELCRGVTGSGNQKRKLFTDDEDMVANFRRCIGLNGINLGSARPDLIDRGLIYEPEPITDEDRKLEEEIWSEFEKIRPQLLAYIFDILVEVLKLKQNGGIKLERLPRMADFALHCEMISRCMGNPDNAFIDAFAKNVNVQTIESIASNPVAVVVMEYMKDTLKWKGLTTLLHTELQSKALLLGINTRDKLWPKAPNALSRKLTEVATPLRKAGINIESYTEDSHKNVRTIEITKTSPQSPQSPQNEKNNANRAQITSDKSGFFCGDISPNKTHGARPSNQKLSELLGNYLAFDFEWDGNADSQIEAASFVDSSGNSEVKFRNRDFNGSEADLLDYINTKILSYKWSMGWNTQGNPIDVSNIKICDLYRLHQRCKANNVPSIVQLRNQGIPFIAHSELGHIDLLNVYSKVMVKDGMYHNYRTNKLDDVSKALLGYGKYGDYSGEEFNSLPIEEAEKYSLRDSELVMDLSKYNNFEVLDAMLAIADITGLDFERVCRTNLSTWWATIFNAMAKEGECSKPVKLETDEGYEGAEVLPPKKGIYKDIVVIDAKSLYPSVVINYNLSFDRINCDCCKDDSKRIINKIIPEEFTKDCNFINPATDWICGKKDGAFPTKLKVFKAERLAQKALGNKAKQHALKILINGGYGVFGSSDYDYYDPRVAELITAAGRYILFEMQRTANRDYGFEIIYGDTDSLFLNKTSDKSVKDFQEKFNKKYDIELEVKNRYDKLLLSAGKKHYCGYENNEIDIVGYEGKKSDRCTLFHQVFFQILQDIFKREIDPILNVRKIFRNLDFNQVNSDLLQISKRVNKPLDEYEKSSQIYKIATATGAKQGDLIKYFSANEKKVGRSWTLDYAEADIPHYKQLLWNTIDETLEIAGDSLVELAKEFDVKVEKKPNKKSGKKSDKSKKKR
jgi:DNA polymerase elongation subunit (family B)